MSLLRGIGNFNYEMNPRCRGEEGENEQGFLAVSFSKAG